MVKTTPLSLAIMHRYNILTPMIFVYSNIQRFKTQSSNRSRQRAEKMSLLSQLTICFYKQLFRPDLLGPFLVSQNYSYFSIKLKLKMFMQMSTSIHLGRVVYSCIKSGINQSKVHLSQFHQNLRSIKQQIVYGLSSLFNGWQKAKRLLS